MKMKKYMIALSIISFAGLSGCAGMNSTSATANGFINPTPESFARDSYGADYSDCQKYAKAGNSSVAGNAVAGAALGAAIYSAVGALYGVADLRGAGIGALTGAATFGGSAAVNNRSNYKEIMLTCMRHRGYEVY